MLHIAVIRFVAAIKLRDLLIYACLFSGDNRDFFFRSMKLYIYSPFAHGTCVLPTVIMSIAKREMTKRDLGRSGGREACLEIDCRAVASCAGLKVNMRWN